MSRRLVDADNSVHVIEAFIEALNLLALGFVLLSPCPSRRPQARRLTVASASKTSRICPRRMAYCCPAGAILSYHFSNVESGT
jgi:hypothetical protein